MQPLKAALNFILCLSVSASLFGVFAQPGTYQWQSVQLGGGGFVPGLVFSPVAKGMLYARTDMATAYRWNDANGTWIPMMDWLSRSQMQYIGVEAIAADPVDSNVVYMAVGTYTSSNGAIIKSSDRGTTWTWYTIDAPMGGNSDGRSAGERLMVDPNNTNILYFGSRTTGLWKSVNAGAAWNKVTSFPVMGNSGYGLSFVVFDKTSGTPGNGSSTIYVGVIATAAGSNLYCSVDSGGTWTLVAGTGGPTGQMPIHATFGPNHVMWLAYNSGPPPSNSSSGAVWKYAPATGAWTNVNPAGHGGGIGGITVSATDSNFAITTTIDWWNPDEIYRTTDGGASWTGIDKNAKFNMNGCEYLCFGPAGCTDPSNGGNGWDGDIQIDPFNEARVFHTVGQGVWNCVNDTAPASEVVWNFVQKNFEETVGMYLTSSVKKSLFASCGDVGIQRFPTDSLDTPSTHGMVTNPLMDNGGSVDFAGLNPDIVVDNGSGGDGYSFDNGITWKPFTGGPGGNVAVSADGSTFIAMGSSTVSAGYSRDSGKTWTNCTGVPNGATICSDRVNPKKFYACSGGTLYASTDGAATFTAATTGLSGSGRASAVFGMEGEVWVVANNLYHSSSSGASATKVTTVSQVSSVGFGAAAPSATYPAVYIIGTVNNVEGVFRSINEGATWVQVNDSLHQYGEMDNVAGDEDYYGRVYVTTQGRGVPYGVPLATGVLPALSQHYQPSLVLKRNGSIITAEGSGQLVLFDMLGHAIRYGTLQSGHMELTLKGLRQGVYFVRHGSSVLRVGLVD
jgi:hypothetical protein